MKRVSMLLSLLFAATAPGYASQVHVSIPNYNSYGQGMICIVDQDYNSRFSDLIHAPGMDTDRTSRETALKLLGFFKDIDTDACYVPKGTLQHVDVPDRSTVYVVTIVMTTPAEHVYWNVTNLDTTSGSEQYVAVDAPTF
jgi:hypothetical protein